MCARRASRQRMRSHLESLAKEIPAIGDVRGLGAMVAFEMVKDPKSKEPDAAVTAAIVAAAEKRA